MTLLDTILRPQAASLINQFGRNITYRRQTDQQPFDSDHLVDGTKTTGDTTVKAVTIETQSEGSTEQAQYIEAASIVDAGTWEVHIAAQGLSFVPAVNDQVIFNGYTWDVIAVQTHQSGEQAAMYTLTVKRVS
jgi:hypothetical protein